ncbi:cyclin-dependent protein kinase [Mycoemilia scoparia]|uniref:Cyclin-dependent kinase 8 n=1 Tax=Mycoemilia scoparia TaxID=417184 RepID=A0A9W8DQ74_9FUNG|nr:cyclin-dependent protein kinase [Mycoemilia scoparia]
MEQYRKKRELTQSKVKERYIIVGFISSGTYGRVYKACPRTGASVELAIKKFKPEKVGDVRSSNGISQSACREIALCRELRHENIVDLYEVILEDNAIHMIMDYAEYDLYSITVHHARQLKKSIPEQVAKSMLWQLLNGVAYLHSNWVMHRDLKPANILITSTGVVKVGDLGLARIHRRPFQTLYASDKVVVTVWYRAPELLLGAKHYTVAIEILRLQPIFKGEEVKSENPKVIPFQKHQMSRVCEVLGMPTRKYPNSHEYAKKPRPGKPNCHQTQPPLISDRVFCGRIGDVWPTVESMPEYPQLKAIKRSPGAANGGGGGLKQWYSMANTKSERGYQLLARMLDYNPETRITAAEALDHPYFHEDPIPVLQ